MNTNFSNRTPSSLRKCQSQLSLNKNPFFFNDGSSLTGQDHHGRKPTGRSMPHKNQLTVPVQPTVRSHKIPQVLHLVPPKTPPKAPSVTFSDHVDHSSPEDSLQTSSSGSSLNCRLSCRDRLVPEIYHNPFDDEDESDFLPIYNSSLRLGFSQLNLHDVEKSSLSDMIRGHSSSSIPSTALLNRLMTKSQAEEEEYTCELLPVVQNIRHEPEVHIYLSRKQQMQLQQKEQQAARVEAVPMRGVPSNGVTIKPVTTSTNVEKARVGTSGNLKPTSRVTPATSSSSSLFPLRKCQSQVSLVKPVLIHNGPSISGHQPTLTANNSCSRNNHQPSVRSLPQKPAAPVHPTIRSQRVQPQVLQQPQLPKSAAVVFPDLKSPQSNQIQSSSSGSSAIVPVKKEESLPSREEVMIPETRDHPAGINVDEFLPKYLQKTARLGFTQLEMPESEAMSDMIRGHSSVVSALAHRRKNIQIVLAMWNSKDHLKALDQAVQLEDDSVLVDILNVINLKPSFWTLDLCQMLLPSIHELLQSKYESYISVGCSSLRLILKNFCLTITSTITALPGIGVDLSREERYNKCMSCYKQLVSIRAFVLKRQTLQGKLGRTFRDLAILMQSLE